MEDIHMETPPVSALSDQDPLESAGALLKPIPGPIPDEDASKARFDRTSLGVSIIQDFGHYRDILDEHHERRERIIKVSRDINNFSKKMIFALHRAEPKDYLPQFRTQSEALAEFKEKHTTVLKLFHRVAIDLQGSNYHRYQRSVSGAMQEYIEAMTLEYYLLYGQLMPKSALEEDLVFMTSQDMMDNPDLIIPLGLSQLGGGGGGGSGGGGGGSGGNRGKFNKDNRKGPYNKDKRGGGGGDYFKQKSTIASASTPASAPKPASVATPTDESVPIDVDPATPSSGVTSTSVLSEAKDLQPVAAAAAEVKLVRMTLEVTDEDYLLGIADLTGELMRLAINTLGQSMVAIPIHSTGGASDTSATLPPPEERVQQILLFLRTIKSGFDGLSLTRMSPISKKMGVLKQSLNKIELACYNVRVRGAEYPPEMMRQLIMSGQDIGGSGGGGGGEGGNEDDD